METDDAPNPSGDASNPTTRSACDTASASWWWSWLSGWRHGGYGPSGLRAAGPIPSRIDSEYSGPAPASLAFALIA